jgi:hypothetical protein
MKRYLLALLALLSLAGPGLAERKFPDKFRQELQDITSFRTIYRAKDVPWRVRGSMGPSGDLADPGGQWEEREITGPVALPTRRLIWAATNGHLYVVHYESIHVFGGRRTHEFHVVILAMDLEPELDWFWRGIQPKGMSALLGAIDGKPAE